MDDYDQGDHRLPRMAFPPKYLTADVLKQRTGVFIWRIPINEGMVSQLNWITNEHKFVFENELQIKEGLTPRLDEKIKEWYQPHTHALEESRLVLDGQAYYDIEDPSSEKWIRVLIEKGDLIIIPVGCMHRFTPDTKNFVQLRRYYQTKEGEPHAISQELSQTQPGRTEYLSRYSDVSR